MIKWEIIIISPSQKGKQIFPSRQTLFQGADEAGGKDLVMPGFTNASACERSSLQTEVFSKILLPSMNSVSGVKHSRSHPLSDMCWWLLLVGIAVADKTVLTCCEAFLSAF